MMPASRQAATMRRRGDELGGVGDQLVDLQAERETEVEGADEDHVDAGGRGDRGDLIERIRRLDHDRAERRARRVDLVAGERSPAADALRRVMRCGDRCGSLVGGADQWDDHAVGTRVERAADQGRVVRRDPDEDRRFRLTPQAQDVADAPVVVVPVLRVDTHPVEAETFESCCHPDVAERRPHSRAHLSGTPGSRRTRNVRRCPTATAGCRKRGSRPHP